MQQQLFHRVFSLSLPTGQDGVEQGFLLLTCLAMSIDRKISKEEMADAVHIVQNLYGITDLEEADNLIREVVAKVNGYDFDEAVEKISGMITEPSDRRRAMQVIAFISDADQKVSPIESAMMASFAKAFGFDEQDELDAIFAELDAEVLRARKSVPQTPENNPFLAHGALPRFEEIAAWQVVPAVETLLPQLEDAFERLEKEAAPTWEDLVEGLELLGDRFGFTWGLIGHLLGVANSDELRQAYQEVQPALVDFSIRMGQSKAIYEKLVALQATELTEAQQRVVDALVLQAEHSGVGLGGDDRKRFNAIQQELAQLSTDFGNNLLDATKAWELLLTDKQDVEGLPESALQLAAHSARQAGHDSATTDEGPWRITLEVPSVMPFLRNATNRELREKVYRGYLTRASSGDIDNTPLIERILELRKEEAKLLGYETFADLSLSAKMAPDVGAVRGLIEDLREASWGAAKEDLEELEKYAVERAEEPIEGLAHWDIAFWAERMREERYGYKDEEVRPYFPLEHVLSGLFALVGDLFGVRIEAADGKAPSWHHDVRFFEVFDGDRQVASFYLDPYSRPATKRGGAWHATCVGRSKALASEGEAVRLPISYMACNQSPPVEDKPSLMTFSEVTTLFHEFGHGLQHMLTEVDSGMASGIKNIEWDAVELPSQFMENWCYQPSILRSLTRHYETGDQIPDEYIDKIIAARNYRAGSAMLRQLYFGLLDMELHASYDSEADGSVFEVQRRIAENTSVLELLDEDRFLCSFAHIFAGGYAAGYYSYKWAEVLSADAFAAFEEAGLDDSDALSTTGRRFRQTVLASGGSRDPMDVFVDFRGRAPDTEPLLRHNGLA